MAISANEPRRFIEIIAALNPGDWTEASAVLQGKRYQQAGRVGKLVSRSGEIFTLVRESRNVLYRVYFLEDRQGITALCDCPFERGLFCRHLTAAVLACRDALQDEHDWSIEQEVCPETRIHHTLDSLQQRPESDGPFKALELDAYLILHDLRRSALPTEQRMDVGMRTLECTLEALLTGGKPSAWPVEFVRCLIGWSMLEADALDNRLGDFLVRLFTLREDAARELAPAIIGACSSPVQRSRLAMCLRSSLSGQGSLKSDTCETISNIIDRLCSCTAPRFRRTYQLPE